MTTAYTSLLGLALPVTGELSGTWGDTVNDSITSLLDTAVAGTTNVSADSNVTLTTTTGASNQARQAILLFSGARTAIRTVIAPAQSKIYTVINATTGGYAVQLVGAGPTTGVTIANGARTVVAWNGSDFVEVSSPSSIILPGGTANGVLYLNGSKVVTSGSALVFDGTNLGIGTNSPASDARLTLASPTTESYVMFSRTNSGVFDAAIGNNGGSLVFKGGADSSTVAGLTDLMRITSDGNLGLGVTPSAWALSNSSALQIKNAGFAGYLNNAYVTANQYFTNTGGSNYIANGFASMYIQQSGQHQFHTAASGTAGNGVTFTQAMTLDASGNLQLATTTPVLTSANRGSMTIGGSASSILFLGTGSTTGGYLFFEQSTGGMELWNGANSYMRFATNNTERARIDSSGNLLVGTTTASGKLYVTDSTNPSPDQSVFFENSNAGFNKRILSLNASRNATSSEYQFLVCSISGIESKFIIQNSGNAQNRNNSYGAISDAKLKENIVDATPKLADLMQVKIRNFNFKTSPQEKQIGVVAQELETIFPSLIDESKDRDEEGNDLSTTTKAVKYSVFVPMLIKAMQEQQAIIESLKARLDAANL